MTGQRDHLAIAQARPLWSILGGFQGLQMAFRIPVPLPLIMQGWGEYSSLSCSISCTTWASGPAMPGVGGKPAL